jgi:hypothetical protein
MPEKPDTKIAGEKTVAEWQALKPTLALNAETAVWRKAFDEFFRARLQSRYFDPIDTLRKNRRYHGEGFSIVALQCSLIEFLAASLKGESYRNVSDKQLGSHEYNRSGVMFSAFLSAEEPFKKYFSQALADEFYSDVRCALLHEARTRNGWRIRLAKQNGLAIDAANKIICPESLQKLFLEYVGIFGERVAREPGVQEAFIRKFDSLCH